MGNASLQMVFNLFIISLLCFLPSCSPPKKSKKFGPIGKVSSANVVKMDRNGSLDEQLAYHQAEIKKYQAAIAEEQAKANLYLAQYEMNAVRQANSRKFQYLKKIEEHTKAIQRLQTGS